MRSNFHLFSGIIGTAPQLSFQRKLALKILVLSPHRDDAAFSLAVSMNRWLASGHDVEVLNVFTRSLYAPYVNAAGASEGERIEFISEVRKKEDRRALTKIGVDLIQDLEIEDAPMRLKCNSSIVCDIDVDPGDHSIPKIRRALEKIVLGVGPEAKIALVLPLGLGHHVDHRLARDAALLLSTGWPCAFYEDLPYAAREGVSTDLSRFREDVASRLHEQLLPVHCHGCHTHPAEWKRTVALLYKSQIDPAMADTIANFLHRYEGAERLWANESWLALAEKERLSTRQRDGEAERLPA